MLTSFRCKEEIGSSDVQRQSGVHSKVEFSSINSKNESYDLIHVQQLKFRMPTHVCKVNRDWMTPEEDLLRI